MIEFFLVVIIFLFKDHFLRPNNETLPLTVNASSSFTVHFAVWPYVGLFSLIIFVWSFIYISKRCANQSLMKTDRRRLSSFCTAHDSTIAVGYEVSMTV